MAKIVFTNAMTGFTITRRHVVDMTSSVSVRRYPDVIPGNYVIENTCAAKIKLKEGTGAARVTNIVGTFEINKFSDLQSYLTVWFGSSMNAEISVKSSRWWWNPVRYPWTATFFGLLNHKLKPE